MIAQLTLAASLALTPAVSSAPRVATCLPGGTTFSPNGRPDITVTVPACPDQAAGSGTTSAKRPTAHRKVCKRYWTKGKAPRGQRSVWRRQVTGRDAGRYGWFHLVTRCK
jgi:hypothetical protein